MSDGGEGSSGEARTMKKFLVAMGEDIAVLVVVVVGVREANGGCRDLDDSRGLFIPLVVQPERKLP
jgi:hypothetical protein